jgi:hypothetical protein
MFGVSLGIIDSGGAGGGGGSYESIATATGTGSSGIITFSSIPSTYKHLQIRILCKSTSTSSPSSQMYMTFNNDSGGNYSYHRLTGNGSTAGAAGATGITGVIIDGVVVRSPAYIDNNICGTAIIDIQDYTATTRNKTVRAFSGADRNSTSNDLQVALNSSVWLNTAAISRIDLDVNGGNYATNSVISLYGIKG